jgi:polar amino acid transport system substrate-binding protein
MIKLHSLALMLILSWNACAQELVKVIAVEYTPFSTTESETFGIVFDHLKPYAETHFKAPYEPYFLPPARAQLVIEQGDWCVSFYPPHKTNENPKFVPLSPEHVKLGLYRLEQATRFNYESLSELSGSVAMLRSNTLGSTPKMLEDAGLELVHLEKIEQGIHMLLAGRVNYAFGDSSTLKTYAHIDNINKLQFSEIPIYEARIGFFYNTDCEAALFKQLPY